MNFNSGFKNFVRYSDSTKIPLLIYLHADQEELKNHTYNKQGQEIINFCAKNKVPLIQELKYKFKEDDYRDGIHLSEKGQRHMYTVLKTEY
jgi:lysophospholipase L1-like esterase